MAMFNKRDGYGNMAITLHWLLFILIVGLIAGGKYSASLDDKNVMLIGIHKQMGLAVFVLMAFRLLWRLINTAPTSLSESFITRAIAFLVHWLLYLVVLTQVWIGVAMSQLSERKVFFFNIIEIPDMSSYAKIILSYIPATVFSATKAGMQMRELHYWGAIALIVLIGLHFLGAMAHHFLFGDDTLRRMFYGYVPNYAKNLFKGDSVVAKKKK